MINSNISRKGPILQKKKPNIMILNEYALNRTLYVWGKNLTEQRKMHKSELGVKDFNALMAATDRPSV